MFDATEKKSPSMSWRARIVRRISSLYFSRIDVKTADVMRARKRLDLFAGLGLIAPGVSIREDTIAGLHADWLTPRRAADDRLLLYWHGGGYVIGSGRSHRPFVSHIARLAGIRALLPDYRLAPEHPFPAAVEDSVQIYRALLTQGYEPGNIVVAGDSAGGGLTAAMLLSLRDAGDPLPRAACLLSPWLDLSGQGESMASRAARDPWFHGEGLLHVARYYCEEDELANPLVSPVFADASGLPPTLIQVGDDELLLSDSERFAANIRAADGEVEIDVWPGMWHVWQMFIGLMPESRQAVEKLGEFIRRAVA